MGKYYDVISGFKLALGRFTDKELLKWAAVQFIGSLVLTLVLSFSLAVFFVATIPSESTAAALASADPSTIVALIMGAGLGVVSAFIFLFVLWMALATLWSLYTVMFMARAAMGLSGIPVPSKPQRLLDLFVLNLRVLLLNAGCWYDRKLLTPAAAALVLALLVLGAGLAMGDPSIASFAPPLAILTLILWALGSFVHSVRTTFANYLFFRGDGVESAMPRESYGLVAGQTLEVAIAVLAGSVFLMVVMEGSKYIAAALASIPPVGPIAAVFVSAVVSILGVSFLIAYVVDVFGFYAGKPSSGASRAALSIASMPKAKPAPKAGSVKKAKGRKR
ncbi:MAG: hypothetical protein V1728_05125 [Candidatus Micrarchaeota archaeon]